MTGIDESLKPPAFEGVVPSEESIADGSYSLTDGYYAVVRKDLPQGHRATSVIKDIYKEISYDKAAKIACCSTFHFQRMFSYIAEFRFLKKNREPSPVS